MNRREFFAGSATLAAASLLRADDKPVKPMDKLTVALIGCGGMGRYNLGDFMRLPDFDVVGVCDPDPSHTKGALDQIKSAGRPIEKVQVEKDFRRLLERKDLDAVIVGTPDHWHAYVLIAACASGKDVYCEKPLSHNIVEGRKMVEAARKNKRVVQIGTQQRSGKHFIDAANYVRSGKLGQVYLCRTWITNRTPPQGHGNPPDEASPPPGVDYDLWLGPAPKRPFNRARFHHDFRWFWDYGNGLCNDWGVHLNDVILWGMNVSSPIAVTAQGGKHDMKDNSDTPDSLDVYYEYPGFTHIYTIRRGQSLTGFHGKGHGMEFVGTKATLTLDRGGWFVTPAGEKKPSESHGGSEQHFAHVQDFLRCVRNRKQKTASDIEDMHHATVTAHLANISFKVKRKVYWDAKSERCYRAFDAQTGVYSIEDGDANAYLLREPRKPWSLEG
jgi:predicted dehydrogenase